MSPVHPPAFSHKEVLVVIGGVMLVMFLSFLDQTIVSTALPRIADDIQGDTYLSWVVAGYLLASTAVTPIYGKLSDYYGRRVMLQSALLIFIAASILCALATSMPQLILFRILQGVGGGGLLSTAHATIADVVSLRERGKYQGYISSTVVLGNALGPVLGGIFAEDIGWRWIFWINVPLGLLALVVMQVALAKLEVKRLKHKIDYIGAVLVMAALAAVLLVTTLGGGDLPWTSPKLIWGAAIACVLVALATLWEFSVPEAILPPRLFRNPVFACSVAGTAFGSMCLVGMGVYMPLYLQLARGLGADQTGMIILPLTVGMVAGSSFSGIMIARIARYRIFPLIGTPIAIASLAALALMSHETPLILVIIAMGGFSIGIGLGQSSALVAAQNAVDPYDLGAGTGVVNCSRSMFSSFGVTLLGAILIGRLNALLTTQGIAGVDAISLIHAGPQALTSVAPAMRGAVASALDQAFGDMFLGALGIAVLTFIAYFLLRDAPLRTVSGHAARNTPAPLLPEADAGAID